MASYQLLEGDCVDVMRGMEPASVDAVVCDPPYGLEFMGKEWDRLDRFQATVEADIEDTQRRIAAIEAGEGEADRWRDGGGFSKPGIGERQTPWTSYGGETANPSCRTCGGRARGARKCSCAAPDWHVKGRDWRPGEGDRARARRMQEWHEAWAREALRVLKPGGHLLAFGGTRTYHRLACAIEDAGFEVRDTIAWMYGQGFPKSLNPGCKCGSGEAATEYDVRPVRDADLPAPVDAGDQRGQVLLAGVPERGASADGAVPAAGELRTDERLVAGRRDPEADARDASGRALRAGSGVGAADGTHGRLRDAAPPPRGADGRAAADANGGRASSEPRSAGQSVGELGAMADEPGSQARGGWPLCPRCGEPVGLGTALKPSHEPVVVARKPLAGTVAGNVLAHGVGALNVDGCRIEHVSDENLGAVQRQQAKNPLQIGGAKPGSVVQVYKENGRWPANVVLDPEAADVLDQQTGELHSQDPSTRMNGQKATRAGVTSPFTPERHRWRTRIRVARPGSSMWRRLQAANGTPD
jgi:hypothetical protein